MNITWLTQGSFLFENNDTRIVVDPYMSNCLETRGLKRLVDFPLSLEELKPDLLICSHDHLDHLDPETVKKIAALYPKCIFWGPKSCCEHFRQLGIAEDKIVLLEEGETYTFGKFSIIPVPAMHSDPDSVGFVIEEDKKVYLSADSKYDDGLINKYNSDSDVVLICVNGTLNNMSINDALNVVKQIKPKFAFPMHYGLFAGHTVHPKPFVDGCEKLGIKSKALQAGISCELDDLLAD
jgi:L-ascorbate metabolism protein UlaG (beta-lactamase superfamily)